MFGHSRYFFRKARMSSLCSNECEAESSMLDVTASNWYHANMARKLISDQLRAIIEGCGHTRYAIAKATGISQPTLSRFMSGERGLPLKTLDQLGVFLDLQIAMRPKRQASRKD